MSPLRTEPPLSPREPSAADLAWERAEERAEEDRMRAEKRAATKVAKGAAVMAVVLFLLGPLPVFIAGVLVCS